ncbi:MAG: thiamine phosphate synthase [Acidobacteriota bacterium]|nr:thiamine phosphate synthase [Acidobacteriota bacterium]
MLENPRARLAEARLYLLCEGVDEPRLDAALRGGVDIVELLDDGAQSDAQVLAAAARLRPICERHGALLMLNNRPALVAAAGADGVHIDKPGLDLEAARAAIGPGKLLGASAHGPAEIDAAQQLPLDYISVGPVHATPVRPRATPVGHALITYASRNSKLPFFAVGGIEPHNTGAVAAAGAQRIAVVRAISESSDPERSAAVLRAEITSPVDFLERYRARTEAQNAAARARLQPLAAGERPWPLQLSAAVAALAALVNLVAYLAGARLQGSRLSTSELVPFVVVMLILAAGMWRRSGAAVLLFMVLLAIIVVLFSLFLIEASNLLGVIVPLLFIGGGGYLFWKLVRVLGRIQAPQSR